MNFNLSKRITLLLRIMFGVSVLFAQDGEEKTPEYGWKNNIVGNLNLSQTSLNNWAAGGENTWAWQLDFNGQFENDQEKINWKNTGKLSYGRTKVGDGDSKKSSDEIRLESVLTYKIGRLINPYAAFTGETQLTSGFNFDATPKVEISRFLNPGYFTESFGAGYKPNDNFSTRMGLAFKQTIATDDTLALAYSDDVETLNEVEKLRSEIGLESVTDYNRKLSENILFTTKLELFSNFSGVDEVDVRWDNIFAAKVSKYIGVNFNVKLYYDKDISVKRQLKQVLGAGITYTFL